MIILLLQYMCVRVDLNLNGKSWAAREMFRRERRSRQFPANVRKRRAGFHSSRSPRDNGDSDAGQARLGENRGYCFYWLLFPRSTKSRVRGRGSGYGKANSANVRPDTREWSLSGRQLLACISYSSTHGFIYYDTRADYHLPPKPVLN